ncbi:Para-hydroxybenzoate--polyprenyltransferase, mitochondrial precursor (PHB:polyprenyltransferase) [Marasmius tenuissimus]|uniref:Para-hydroxybenzoate--polyprenyltransferase, mitochondrial (PHB:polyprenyltransferase) n=1 Tax=Marasmius tenuissimus TaxID=585030 RepID=A0ABR2Z6I8_9AGAR
MAYNARNDIAVSEALAAAILYVPLCFGIKSLIMTIDDILDWDIDLLVSRTKARPIPRGAISLERAWLFFAIQVAVGVVLASQILDNTSIRIVQAVSPLYVIYPTCKRWTNLAPIPLGIMFNIGIFMGWSYLSPNTVAWNVLVPAYLGACLWTCTYETVYQHQDKLDDAKIKLYSPALYLGNATIPVCIVTGALFFALITYSGIRNGQGFFYFVSLAYAGFVLFRQLFHTDIDVPDECKEFFLLTTHVGRIILMGLVVDVAYRKHLMQVM